MEFRVDNRTYRVMQGCYHFFSSQIHPHSRYSRYFKIGRNTLLYPTLRCPKPQESPKISWASHSSEAMTPVSLQWQRRGSNVQYEPAKAVVSALLRKRSEEVWEQKTVDSCTEWRSGQDSCLSKADASARVDVQVSRLSRSLKDCSSWLSAKVYKIHPRGLKLLWRQKQAMQHPGFCANCLSRRNSGITMWQQMATAPEATDGNRWQQPLNACHPWGCKAVSFTNSSPQGLALRVQQLGWNCLQNPPNTIIEGSLLLAPLPLLEMRSCLSRASWLWLSFAPAVQRPGGIRARVIRCDQCLTRASEILSKDDRSKFCSLHFVFQFWIWYDSLRALAEIIVAIKGARIFWQDSSWN